MENVKPTPYELWKLSGENQEAYVNLLVAHGLAVPKDPTEESDGIACVLVLTFRGQQLKLFEAKKLPALPSVGDLINGHEVLAVREGRAGSVPIIILLWSKDQESPTSRASTLRAPDDSSSR
jgi:hypothetical protein